MQLEEVCRQFMAYYRAQSGYNRSGSITLIRADQLDGLAAAARDVWSAGNLADVSAGEVQPFERMHTHKFFDLADYYSRLVPVPQYTDFDEQLSRTVLFSDYTDPDIQRGRIRQLRVLRRADVLRLVHLYPATRVAFA